MKSIKLKLMLAFLFLIISFSVVAVIMYQSSKQIITSSIEESAFEKMHEYATYVELLQNQVYDSATLVYLSDELKEWLSVHKYDEQTHGTKMLANLELSKYLTQVTNSYTPIANITIYHENGTWVSSENVIKLDDPYLDEIWYSNIVNEHKYWHAAGVDRAELVKGNDQAMLSMVMPMDSYDPNEARVFLKINVSEQYFLKSIERLHLGESGNIFLVDDTGQLLLSGQRQLIQSHQYLYIEQLQQSYVGEGKLSGASPHGQKEWILYKSIPRTKWVLIGLVNEDDLYAKLIQLRQTIITVVSCLLLVSIGVTLWISHSISSPLNALVGAMRQMKRGDFLQAEQKISGVYSNTLEIAYVIDSFKKMLSQLKDYIAKHYQLSLLKQKAEYRALLMQINPHFLFNTLEMISSLALQNRNKETANMIGLLGHMMRYSIKVSDDLVSFSEELRFIEQYLDIIKFRFAERSQIEVLISGDFQHVRIVKFMLQPLIENAVKFSSECNEFVHIKISCIRYEQHIEISIADNGPGISSEQQYLLKQQLLKPAESSSSNDSTYYHIGLQNVLRRCYAIYGDQFHYKLDKSELGGANIMLHVPIKEAASHV